MSKRFACKAVKVLGLVGLMVGFMSLAAGPVAADETNWSLEKSIERAFRAKIPQSQLDPIIVRSLSKVKMNLSPKEEEIALNAWKKQTYRIGPGKLTLGIADGFGDNVWRKLQLMELILQAMQYPEIGKIVYLNAHGKLENAISDMRSLITQKVDMIVGYIDHGDALLPTMREAFAEHGIPTAAYIGVPYNGIPGKDFTSSVRLDAGGLTPFSNGAQRVEIAQRLVGKKGTVLLLSGTLGNPYSASWHSEVKEGLKKIPGSDWEVLEAVTYWTQQGAFDAMAGVLATGKKVDIIMYDYANSIRGVVRAYEQAGKQIPIIITDCGDNGLFKDFERVRPTNPDFRLFITSSDYHPGRIAITAVVEAKQGAKVPPKIIVPLPNVELKPGAYNPKMPDEWGGSELIPESLIMKMFPPKGE